LRGCESSVIAPDATFVTDFRQKMKGLRAEMRNGKADRFIFPPVQGWIIDESKFPSVLINSSDYYHLIGNVPYRTN
jgi:hypothetical protein